jgi:hypothetical protein
VVVVHRLRRHAGGVEVARQRVVHLRVAVEAAAVEPLELAGHAAVEPRALHRVEAPQQVRLEEPVPEPVEREPALGERAHRVRRDQSLPAAGLAAEEVAGLGHGRPVMAATTSPVNSSPSTLATSRAATQAGERWPMRVAMAASTRVGSSSQRSVGPSTQRPSAIASQVAPHLHATQELDGEQRVPAGACRELGAEGGAERVRLGVEDGVHERGVGGAREVDQAGLRWRGARRPRRRAGGASPPSPGDVLRAVGADDQHARGAEAAGEVEEEVDRGGVDPLEVVQQEEHALAAGQVAEDGRELLEQRRARPDRSTGGPNPLDQRLQPNEAILVDARVLTREAQQAARRHEASEQVGPVVEERVDRVGQALPGAAGLLRPMRPRLRRRLRLAAQHAGDVHERLEGIALAGERTAVSPQHEQAGVVVLGAARELGEQFGLAAARLAHHEHRADALGVDAPQGGVEGRELRRARDEQRAHRWRGRLQARPDERRTAGSAPTSPAWIAAASRVVSASGSTPNSSASTRRQASCCARAAARCPCRASSRMRWRWADSSHGSSVSQRRVAASAATGSPRRAYASARVRAVRTVTPRQWSRIDAVQAAKGPLSSESPRGSRRG